MLPVWAWVLVALVLAITVLALLHYFANPNFIDVKGRAYLITGGSSGIGKAVAKVSHRAPPSPSQSCTSRAF